MTIEKVHLTKEKETLLITLYSRALHSRTADPVLRDPWAEAAVARIDFDFGSLKLTPLHPLTIAIRARQFDTFTRDWIAENPQSTVLHLGCGLDSRVYRVDPPATIRWFDVDYPEVIDLRQQLYPPRPGYQMIASSLVAPSWLDQVPGDLPAMIVAEGVLMYMPAAEGGPLLGRLTNHFVGGRMGFDALSMLGVRMAGADRSVGKTGARFGWGLDDPNDVRQYAPKMQLLAELSTPQLPGWERLPVGLRVLAQGMERFPRLRRMNRVLLYQF